MKWGKLLYSFAALSYGLFETESHRVALAGLELAHGDPSLSLRSASVKGVCRHTWHAAVLFCTLTLCYLSTTRWWGCCFYTESAWRKRHDNHSGLEMVGRTNNHVLKTVLGMRTHDFLRSRYAMLGERRTALRKQQGWKSDSEDDCVNCSRAAWLVLLGFLLWETLRKIRTPKRLAGAHEGVWMTERNELKRWTLVLADLYGEVRQALQLGKMNGKVLFAREAAPTWLSLTIVYRNPKHTWYLSHTENTEKVTSLLDAFHTLTNWFTGLTVSCGRNVRMWALNQLHAPSERGNRIWPGCARRDSRG